MPRSGPRPYDCVRRAWHSERHQPIRGSLIKEIFRVVNEIHSSVTKKNKEWQEKLPIVVLKAEEIMYSKANSEAEYTDLKTLWDRTNDAINTIIRRDEGSETGQFLQPCIEAALTLGCIPRRASRSQRNSNPSCYLNPISNVPSVVENATQRYSTSNPQYRPLCSNFLKPKAINSNHRGFESRCHAVQNNGCTTLNLRVAAENVPPSGYPQSFPRGNQAASNFSTALYYGNFPLVEDLKHGFFMLPEPVSDPLEPVQMGVIPNLLHNGDESNKSTLGATSDYHENPCTVACDLSLRLGLLSSQSPIGETSQPQEVRAAGAQEGTKCSGHSTHLDKRLSFFDKGSEYGGGPRDSYPSRMNSEGEYTNVQAAIRKRKVAVDHQTDGIKFCSHPEPPFDHLIGSMRN